MEVGVSYSADPEEVTSLLLQCAGKQQEILLDQQHKPFVRFQDFGDNALVFYLMFWTRDIFRVEQLKSDLRYQIFKTLRDHQINIPYPQLEVHVKRHHTSIPGSK